MKKTISGSTTARLALFATSLVAVIAIGSVGVNAADLPTQQQVYVSPPVVAPIYNWTGIYLGANAGYGFGKQDPLGLFSDDFSAFNYKLSGGMIGGTLGAQIQSGHVVMGLEGDIDWTSMSGVGTGPVVKAGFLEGSATIASKVSIIDTLRTRIGYAQDNLLFYGTVGVALTNNTSAFTQTVGFTCNTGVVACTSKSDWHAGLAAGAGIEYGWTPNLSTKLEYLWVGAGAANTLYENMVRVGVNYRFGG
ncbi:MAG: porin family protein [Bradyrhizobium sp.]|uniref:outer membrane protein n=1 Tax=Bradyrhizobium sp. TaxID=376 RepID=UPI0011F634D0|nr:outer membrane beta-barrel protein [Bradyrhizobium sp.]THD61926.1 MAG: porin family protein [Bradyrhizobium sp.]